MSDLTHEIALHFMVQRQETISNFCKIDGCLSSTLIFLELQERIKQFEHFIFYLIFGLDPVEV